MEYTYDDLLDRLTDLKALAVPPAVGETSGCFSSYDRRSRYNEATGLYEDWGANSDGDGYIRREGEDIVALEIDGPWGDLASVERQPANGAHPCVH